MCVKVEIMVGNVGSGKSTQIKKKLDEVSRINRLLSVKRDREKWAVVSKDVLRFMIGGGKYVFSNNLESFIEETSKFAIKYLLRKGINVIVDETNCSIIARANLIEWIRECTEDCIIMAVVMPRVSKEESLRRKALPENSYGYDIETWEKIWERKNIKYVEPHVYEDIDAIVHIGESG